MTLGDFTELNRAIDFADDRGLMRLAGFEQLDHARQTTGNVFVLVVSRGIFASTSPILAAGSNRPRRKITPRSYSARILIELRR